MTILESPLSRPAGAPSAAEDTSASSSGVHRFRDSRRLVLARYLGDLPSLLLGLAGTILWISTWVEPWRTVGFVLMGLTATSMVVGPWLRLMTVTYTVSVQGLQLDSGLISRSSEFLPWDLVNSIDDRAPWSHRAVGLTEVVCAQTGEDGSSITLAGLDAARLEILSAHAVQAAAPAVESLSAADAAEDPVEDRCPEGPRPDEPRPEEPRRGAPSEEAGTLLHRTTVRDLALMSLIYGQVILLVPPVVFGLMEVTDLLGVTDMLEAQVLAGLGSAPSLALIVLAVAALGIGATVVKYHGMTVHTLPDGRLRIRYGLLSTHQRTIAPAAVQGVVWQRNIVEQLTGRTRLALLTLDASSQLGGNLMLPSLPHALTVRLVREHLPRYAASSELVSSGRRTLVSHLLAWAALFLLLWGTWSLTAQQWHWDGVWVSVTVLAVWILAAWAGGILRTRLSADDGSGLVAARRLLFSERVTAIPSSRLHAVTSVDLSVLGHVSAPCMPTVHYFAGSPRRIRAASASKDTLTTVRHMVRTESIPLRA